MSGINTTPQNRNFLKPSNFSFFIHKAPTISYFIQKLDTGAMLVPSAWEATPNVPIPFPGTHIQFDTLKIGFKIDENLDNYNEIYNWLSGMNYPISTDQYKEIISQPVGSGVFSDISVFINDNEYNPNYEIKYISAFPKSLSGLRFDTTGNDEVQVSAEAQFNYMYFTVNKVI